MRAAVTYVENILVTHRPALSCRQGRAETLRQMWQQTEPAGSACCFGMETVPQVFICNNRSLFGC